MKKSNTILYKIGESIYINLTNKCSNNCDFCVRNNKEKFYDYYLWLENEPTAQEVIEQIKANFLDYNTFVFCGFGEPLYKLKEVIEISQFLKTKNKHVRLNSNGQADKICQNKQVAQQLKGLIDVVSISLNAISAKKYQEICHCVFGEDGYSSMLRFAKDCKESGIKVVLSVVDCIGETEIKKAKEIAQSIGVELRIRQYIES